MNYLKKFLNSKINDGSEIQVESSITINELNDDCLIHIFQYLSKKEKLKIERVSKRWNRTSKLSWNKIKKIKVWPHYEAPDWFTETRMEVADIEKTNLTNFYVNIFKRSANYLNILDINFYGTADYFNLNYFLDEFPKYCHNLTHLILYDHQKLLPDECLKILLNNAVNLSSVSFTFFKIDSNWFLNLRAEKIKELSISQCKFISEKLCYEFLSNFKNLNKLEIYDTANQLPKTIFEALLKSECENIVDFYLAPDYNATFYELPLFLSKQKQLRKLRLNQVMINEQLMKSLPAEHLEEFYLEFEDSDQVILKHLHRLQNLKIFEARFHSFTDDYMPKLTKSVSAKIEKIDLCFQGFHENYSIDNQINSFDRLQNLDTFRFHYFGYNQERVSGFVNKILKDLSNCKNLKYLKMRENEFCDYRLIKELENLPNFVSFWENG